MEDLKKTLPSMTGDSLIKEATGNLAVFCEMSLKQLMNSDEVAGIQHEYSKPFSEEALEYMFQQVLLREFIFCNKLTVSEYNIYSDRVVDNYLKYFESDEAFSSILTTTEALRLYCQFSYHRNILMAMPEELTTL